MSLILRALASGTALAAAGAALALAPPTSAAPTSTTCVTGTWSAVDDAGRALPGRDFTVEASASARKVLATSTTDASGRFEVCVDAAASASDFDVDVVYANAHWKVQPGGKAPYRVRVATDVALTAGASHDVGAVAPTAAAERTASRLFDDVARAWAWKPGSCWDVDDTVCRQMVLNWPSRSTSATGASYHTRTNTMELNGDSIEQSTVVHELGHAIMDDVYEDDFPATEEGCPTHLMNRAYGPVCAWTEGWATWFSLTVLGTPIWTQATWDDDIESGPGTRGWTWAEGEDAEIRVAAALWDLADATNEAGETCTEDPRTALWTTFQRHRSATFREFWSQRAADGFAVGAEQLACLQHNTIDFSDVTPAPAGETSGTKPGKRRGHHTLPPRRPHA